MRKLLFLLFLCVLPAFGVEISYPGSVGSNAIVSGGGALSFTNTSTVWLATNGNDSTAIAGRDDFPAASFERANQLVPAGGTVFVYPGRFTITNSILTNGVDYSFLGRGQVFRQMLTTNSASDGGPIDDNLCGATTNTIFAPGWTFTAQGYTNILVNSAQSLNSNLLGTVLVANSNSFLTVKAKTLQMSMWTSQGRSCIYQKGGRLIAEINECGDPYLNVPLTFTNTGIPHNPVKLSQTSGYYWETGCWGEVTIKTNRNSGSGGAYALYGLSTDTNGTSEVYYKGSELYGKIYLVFNSPNYRTWIDVPNMQSTTNSFDGNLMTITGSGKHYIKADKMLGGTQSGANSVLQMNSGSGYSNLTVWLDAQKLSSSGPWVDIAAGKAVLKVSEYEDVGGATNGFLNGGGELDVIGGIASSSNNIVWHTNGTTRLKGLTMTSTNDFPVKVSGAGLIIEGGSIAAQNNTNTIFSTNSQTVAIYGHVMSNTNKNPNITLSPLGAFTIDSGVQ